MMKKETVRSFLAAFGVAVVMVGGVACGSNNANKEAANQAPATEAPATPKLSSQDQDFLKAAAKSGYDEIKLGQLALEKSHNKEVRDFAQKLIDEHQKLAGDLAKLASSKGVTLPDSATLASSFSEGRLKMLSGSHFDQGFLSKMVDDHNDAITTFQKEAANGADTDVKDFASTNVQSLKEHLSTAQELANKTNTRRGTKG
jgi:putative membrane protein